MGRALIRCSGATGRAAGGGPWRAGKGARPIRFVVLRRRTLLAAAFVAAFAVSFAMGWARAGQDLPPVMVDAGHGGVDGGAAAAGILEKDITLDVALRLRQHLMALGIPVAMTRETDTDLGGGPGVPGRHRRDLQERVRLTRACGAALLISLHVNSSRDPSEEGMMFFYARDLPAGRELAEAVRQALQPLHPRREAPIGRRNLYLLRECGIPGVLIELGFITNPADRARLADPEHRDRIARAIAQGVAAFYQRWRASPQPAQ